MPLWLEETIGVGPRLQQVEIKPVDKHVGFATADLMVAVAGVDLGWVDAELTHRPTR